MTVLFVDSILAWAAIVQSIAALVSAGSRASFLIRHGKIGTVEGPCILPPKSYHTHSNGTTASDTEIDTYRLMLWDLTTAFRMGVIKSLQLIHQLPSAEDDAGDRDDQTGHQIEQWLQWRKIERAVFDRLDKRHLAENLQLPNETGVVNDNLPNELIPTEQREPSEAADRIGSAEDRLEKNEVAPTLASTFSETVDLEVIVQRRVGQMTNPLSRSAQIRIYAPERFAELRSSFGLSDETFRRSLLETGPFVSFHSNSKGAARTGGIFFFTRDGAFMIKTIKRDELPALLEMLPPYLEYMRQHGRRSLLTRICGIYDIMLPGDTVQPQTLIIMNSVFPVEANHMLTERFDLKGSLLGRKCSEREKLMNGSKSVLKDLDLALEVAQVKAGVVEKETKGRFSTPRKASYGFLLGAKAKAALMGQLRSDVHFLAKCLVMDYSLLVGVGTPKPIPALSKLKLPDRVLGFPTIKFPSNKDSWPYRKWATMKVPFYAKLSSVKLPFHLRLPGILDGLRRTISSARIIPYADADRCVVDTGPYSCIRGRRKNKDALYYFGLIDFLQPFNLKKAVEWKLKAALYEDPSCVPPLMYAERFLAYLDANIT